MKIKDLINNKAGLEVLGRAKFSDGGAILGVKRILKAYNLALEPYQEMVKDAQEEINSAEKQDKESIGKSWEFKLNTAVESEVEFTPGKTFKVDELIPNGNPHGFDAFTLENLENLGISVE